MQVQRLEDIIREYQARRQELDRFGAYFLGDITDEEAERFSKAILVMSIERQYNTDRPINIYINSGGGSVGAGFAMMEMMSKMKRDYGVRFETVITGYAYSMGAVVFQAGDYRRMGPFSTMMLHGSSWTVSGEEQRVFKDLARLARLYRELVGELFAARTGRYDARWWTRYIYSGRDKFLSARECLELGLVDEVAAFPLVSPRAQR